MEYEKLSKKAMYCMYAAETALGLFLIAVVAVVDYVWVFPNDISAAKWLSLAFIAVNVASVLLSPYFRYHRYRYSINEECIELREGYLFQKHSIIPIERLHKLETRRGPIDRFFGVAKVIVTTGGGDVTIRFLEEKRAEQIAEALCGRINEIAVQERRERQEGSGQEAAQEK